MFNPGIQFSCDAMYISFNAADTGNFAVICKTQLNSIFSDNMCTAKSTHCAVLINFVSLELVTAGEILLKGVK